MSRGVFAGATIVCQPITSKPGYVSETVGQSGASGLRFSEVTPSDFNLPPLTCVRDAQYLEPSAAFELRDRDLRAGGAVAARQLLRVRLGIRDELGDVLGREI